MVRLLGNLHGSFTVTMVTTSNLNEILLRWTQRSIRLIHMLLPQGPQMSWITLGIHVTRSPNIAVYGYLDEEDPLQPRKKLFLYQCLRSYAVLFIALAREWAIYLSICHNIVYRKTPHLFLRFWEPLLSDCRYSVKSDRWEKCSMEEKNSTFVSHHNKDG